MRKKSGIFSGCGIAGIVSFGGFPIERLMIEAMTAALAHRGPSDQGVWQYPPEVAFGHRRLSIQDLSERGHQPMTRGPLTITYNGEVYNFHVLRKELEMAGYRFLSGTDTEVILFAYERWGPACFEKFNGMFAMAIWNARTRELVLARDRIGIKPLYYNLTKDRCVFASEVGALLVAGVPKEWDWDVILRQCRVGSLLGYQEGRTCIRDIREFPPGFWAVVTSCGEMRLSRYWQPPCEKGPVLSEKKMVKEFTELFRDSVRFRLVSDVPVAAFLSGGLDSSAIVTFASSLSRAYRLQTFTTWYVEGYGLGRCGKEENDLKYANIMARFLGRRIEHHVVHVSASMLTPARIDSVVDLARVSDHIRELAILENYRMVSRAGIKVVLNGQGSDELMGGYFGSDWLVDLIHSATDLETVFMEKFFPSLSAIRRDASGHELLEGCCSTYADVFNLFLSFGGDPLEKTHRFLVHTQLRQILRFEDYLSMRYGIECRVPFLDHRIVEFVFSHPFVFHIDPKNRRGKELFRKAMRRVLPKEILRRPKAPFPIGDPEIARQCLLEVLQKYRQEIVRSDLVRRVYAPDFLRHELPEDLNYVELWLMVILWRMDDVLKKAPVFGTCSLKNSIFS